MIFVQICCLIRIGLVGCDLFSKNNTAHNETGSIC